MRVKALHAHRRSHTAIRGPSRAAAHTNFTADARLRVFRVRNFAASAVTHAPVRPSGASTIALVRVQHCLQATRKANLVIEFVDGRPQSYELGCRNASGQPSIDPLVPAFTIVLVASRPNLHRPAVVHRRIKRAITFARLAKHQQVLVDFGGS